MENDLKPDALNIGSKGQHDLRKTIIRMLKDGKKGKAIAKDLGVSEGHVSNVKKLYETGGAAALKPKKRGRPAGKNEILTPEQEKEIQKIIIDKTPEQMRFKECMWTRNNIRQLIKDKYGIEIKLSTLGYQDLMSRTDCHNMIYGSDTSFAPNLIYLFELNPRHMILLL